MFLKNFLILFSILILTKIGICAYRIYIGRNKLSLKYYLGIIEWEKEFLKIAFLVFLAYLLTK